MFAVGLARLSKVSKVSKLSDPPRFGEEIQAVGKYPQDLRHVQNAAATQSYADSVNDVCGKKLHYGSRANSMVKMTPRTTAVSDAESHRSVFFTGCSSTDRKRMEKESSFRDFG